MGAWRTTMEESWNDYDCDNNWDWNDNSYEDTANYIGGTHKSHLTTGHIRQAKSLPRKHKPKSALGKKRHMQHHGTTAAKAFNSSYMRTQRNCASTWQQQRESKDKRRLMTTSHTTSCTRTSDHTTTCRSTQECSPKGRRAGSTTATLCRTSSTPLHGYQQEDPCLQLQVCSLQAGQLRDRDTLLRLRCEISYPPRTKTT